ncbi:MAG TPA: hypothetical protein VH540_19575 [Ktedonobacterales bacterium]
MPFEKGSSVPIQCPQGQHEDAIIKVSGIVAGGTSIDVSVSQTKTPPIWYNRPPSGIVDAIGRGLADRDSTTTTTNVSQSALSQQFGLPDVPEYHTPWGYWSIGIAVMSSLMTVFLLWTLVAGKDPRNIGTDLLALLGCLFVAVTVFVVQHKRATSRRSKVITATSLLKKITPKWEELYYCQKHDRIFVRGKDALAKRDQMIEFLLSDVV